MIVAASWLAGRDSQRRKGQPCIMPPLGWRCTRAAGHEGPCAAIPLAESIPRWRRWVLWAIDGMATESVRDGMNAQAEALREAELLRERAVEHLETEIAAHRRIAHKHLILEQGMNAIITKALSVREDATARMPPALELEPPPLTDAQVEAEDAEAAARDDSGSDPSAAYRPPERLMS